ncbi:hypothetical protein DICVIV_09927 [Dictyocaulus viviparus]|uniref:Uncharacterized protein n=1 Tax=Dictyocaulus viviparus TaxID=29172 RepID=A0A0D8XNV0_DICVI|nr:hypothetical protein DICVIV_09927 [Dictyocaulus viviparus]
MSQLILIEKKCKSIVLFFVVYFASNKISAIHVLLQNTKAIFERSDVLAKNTGVAQFDRLCDMEESIQAIAPVVSCESSCITIFEPQYFGGLRSPQRPYLLLRGCASRLLSVMESPPREVDFLHQASICVSLPLSQIYPEVYTNEVVEAIGPILSCESSCITIFEPQYFGGLRSPQRPYLFLRGCASRLLSVMESPPREVDFLHQASICVSLPLSQIYPEVYTNEVVEVSDKHNFDKHQKN